MIPSIMLRWSAGEFIVTELSLFCGVFRMESGFSTFMGAITEKKKKIENNELNVLAYLSLPE